MRRAVVLFFVLAFATACNARGSLNPCLEDADCPSLEACDFEALSAGDGYCAPICSTDDDCAAQLKCGERGTDVPNCDEKGMHGTGIGICDQFDGAYGPETCSVD